MEMAHRGREKEHSKHGLIHPWHMSHFPHFFLPGSYVGVYMVTHQLLHTPQIHQNTLDPRGSETPDEDRRFLRRRQGRAAQNEK